MFVYIIIVSVWVVFGNMWHVYLIATHKGNRRPLTISEHAVANKRLLWTHRIVHSLPLIVFVPMIFGYLIPNGYLLAALLLMSGAIFDSLETLTLNKRTAPVDSSFNIHHLTTWFMALSYFTYAILISIIAELSTWVYLPILTVCLALLFIACTKIFKDRFLVLQMSYFILVSLLVIIANTKLILM